MTDEGRQAQCRTCDCEEPEWATWQSVPSASYESGKNISYAYDNSGNLATVTDSQTGTVTTYYYDLLDRQVGYREVGTNLDHAVTYIYNEDNQVSSMTEVINGAATTYSYTYDEDNRIVSETVNGITVTYTYDAFGRLANRTVKNGDTVIQTNTPTYSAGSLEGSTSGQVSSYNGYTYTYDDNGNILTISDGTNTTSYEYDSANQLIRENNQALNFTHTWTYDNAGNITSRTDYAYTTGELGTASYFYEYEYDTENWGDLLISYDKDGIWYDEIGNPTSDTDRYYTWQNGRQLSSLNTWTFTYDANGMRTSRVDEEGGWAYTYTYNGDKLVRLIVDGQEYFDLSFTYDASGTPLTITENGYTYYYVTNLQGDVIGIKNSSGQQFVTYTYDAWGKDTGHTNSQTADVNPLRYRGYVYDVETELYYLQSRYYNPQIGRFINADVYVATGQGLLGNNMFTYCGNNPVSKYDPTGEYAVCDERCLISGYGGGGSVLGVLWGMFGWFIPHSNIEVNDAQGEKTTSNTSSTRITSEDIDWNGGDKNHILKGSRLKNKGRSHIKGWRRFGFDPEGSDGWEMLMPILIEVVDDAERPVTEILDNGSTLTFYFKEYVDIGVTVVVKIWTSADGLISKIFDAVPFIVD